ncbi:type II CAAX endopeptidase family protein [uncultured Bacteroides sp.]|uniref:CPBP family intramembrane glutamic endopeptidase n=1 Tax=uncultured Bacteroides sp. TaxID=162156 RepID=UPI002AA73CDC|nr:type II CAAX endopeptidase family protein [uncultured Bacteroides sp.]
MIKAIKLVLIYFGCQIVGALIVAMFGAIISLVMYGNFTGVQAMMLAPAMFAGFLLMAFYLYKADYINREKVTWTPVSPFYLLCSVIIALSAIVLIDYLMSLMPWLPNIMEDSFNLLQSGWFGIVCLTLLGPILEELLFRGAITRVLLRKYTPAKAIVLSALVFGVFHLNPAQIFGAALIGLLLAWIYYKTASLVPCILIHIVNNSLSVYLGLRYPNAEYIKDVVGEPSYYKILVAAALCLVIAYAAMRKTKVAYDWKEALLNRN